jgi:hypothetical protein
MDQRFRWELTMEFHSRPSHQREFLKWTYCRVEYINVAPPAEWNTTLGQAQAQEDDNQRDCQSTVKAGGSDVV